MPDTLQARLDAAVDEVLDVLDAAAAAELELNPLETILRRLQARGQELELEQAPPMLRMILGGMLA